MGNVIPPKTNMTMEKNNHHLSRCISLKTKLVTFQLEILVFWESNLGKGFPKKNISTQLVKTQGKLYSPLVISKQITKSPPRFSAEKPPTPKTGTWARPSASRRSAACAPRRCWRWMTLRANKILIGKTHFYAWNFQKGIKRPPEKIYRSKHKNLKRYLHV